MFQSMTNTSRRANRLEYLFGSLILGVAMMIFGSILAVSITGGSGMFALVGFGASIAMYVFQIILTKNRFNDFGYSGWWMLVPFASLVAFFVPGDATDNKFGPKV